MSQQTPLRIRFMTASSTAASGMNAWRVEDLGMDDSEVFRIGPNVVRQHGVCVRHSAMGPCGARSVFSLIWMTACVVAWGGMMIASVSQAVADEPGESDLQQFYRDYLEKTFAMQPLLATSLGDHRFDAQLDDISAEARSRWLSHDRDTLAALDQRFGKAAADGSLSVDDALDYQILRDDLRRSIWLTENFQPFEDDPRVYGGYLSDSVYSLVAKSTLPMEINVTNAIARMKQLPRVVEEAKKTLTHPPASVLATAIGQNRGAIAFYRNDLFLLVGETKQEAELKAAAEEVVALLEEYQTFLEKELQPRATGEWRIGAERFAKKFELVVDMGITAEELLAEAEQEFDRVQMEMAVIARQLWAERFPGKPIPPDDQAGRRQLIAEVTAAVGRDHGEPETLVRDARQTVAAICDFIRERDLLALPDPDRCEIIEMPAFRRGNSLAYLDPVLPLDPAGASYYAISPPPVTWGADKVRSFLEEYNRHMLQILTIHEAYPGHYVQLEYANRVPSLVRKVIGSGTYIEGWAVYTERMMLDQGYGDGNLALRLNQLKFYLRAVANAILDHRMHCSGWSDDEALTFLVRDAYQTEGEARLKVVRAKQSSVQLSTYFSGRTAMMRLRTEIQREQGDAFHLGRYHEAVLSAGSVPVKLLPEIVRLRITSESPQP